MVVVFIKTNIQSEMMIKTTPDSLEARHIEGIGNQVSWKPNHLSSDLTLAQCFVVQA